MPGKPEYVVNFMRFIAQELREYMAKLGVRTVDEMVGRTDLLHAEEGARHIPGQAALDLDAILNNPYRDKKAAWYLSVRSRSMTSSWKRLWTSGCF